MADQTIDSLVLEINLAAQGFQKGVQEVKEAFRKLAEHLKKSGQDIESSGAKATEVIASMRKELLGFLSVLGGGFALDKMGDFARGLANIDAASGRMAANLGMQARDLQAWGLALERMGGNAQSASGFLQGLSSKIYEYQRKGQPLPIDFYLLPKGPRTDTPENMLEDLSGSFRAEAKARGRASAYGHWRAIGGTDDLFNLIMSPDLNRRLAEARKVTARPQDIEAATKLQESWAKLTQTATDLARIVLTDLTPALSGLLDKISSWVAWFSGGSPSQTAGAIGGAVAGLSLPTPSGAIAGATSAAGKNAGWLHQQYQKWRNWWNGDTQQPSAAAPGAQGSAGEAVAGSGSLAERRARFARELAADPALREKVLAISLNENSNPDANRSVIETMMNRADLYEKSLASQARWTSEGGYYDDRSDFHSRALRSLQNARLRAMAEANLEAVLGGSNTSNFATDNASGAWGWNRMHGMFGLDFSAGGEYFGHPVRRDAAGWNRYPAWLRSVQAGASARTSPWINPNLYGGYGAGWAATLNNPVSNSTSTDNSMYLNGPISVFTQAPSAEALARDLRPALERSAYAYSGNDGAH